MKKNASSKLKLDKKTISKLNSTDAGNINGGGNNVKLPEILYTLVCNQTYGIKCGFTEPDLNV
jgi:hypothetical protein